MEEGGRAGLVTAGLAVLAPISWGTNAVTVTELLPDDRPLLVAAMRVIPAALVLVSVGWLSSRWRPRTGEWGPLALLALCNFGLFFPLLAVAFYHLPGGLAAAMGGLQPLLVAGLRRLLFRQRPRRIDLAVGVVAAVGVALVVVSPGADVDGIGLFAAAAANTSFAMAIVLAKRFPTPSDPVASTGWQLLLGSAVLVPLALVVEGPPPPVTAGHAAGYAYLGLVSTGLAYVLWYNGIRRLPAAAPPLLTLAAPVTGAVMGWVILDESLSTVQLAGFSVTLAAIAYATTLTPDPTPPPPRPSPAPARLAPPPDRPLVPCAEGTDPH